MTDREVMQQALEALSAMLTHMGMDEDDWNKPTFDQSRKAESALRAWLAREERSCTCHPDDNPPNPCAKQYSLTQCREMAVREEQEPVAWANINKHGDITHTNNKRMPWSKTPLYTTPPAAQRKEWQGLTDDEIKEIIGPWGDTPIKGYTRKLFDQIEAKLKEKNHG